MLTAEEDMEITALKKQGWSISAIARHVGRDRKTVRAYLNNEREPGVRVNMQRGRFDRFEPYVRQRFVDDRHVWATVLYDEIVALGYDRAYRTFTRALRDRELRPHCEACSGSKGRAHVDIEHRPGEEIQWDWLELGDTPWGTKVYVLVGALSHSGRFRCWLSDSDDQAHLIVGIDEILRRLGGTAKRWRVDRMATVILPGTDRVQRSFAPVAKHYGVGVDPCPPRHGNRKGVVEAAIKFITQRWWRTARVGTLEEAQVGLDGFCVSVGDARRRGEATVGELAEAEPLAPLPPVAYPAQLELSRKVANNAVVSVWGNRYSVPPGLVGAEVTVSWRVGAEVIDVITAAATTAVTHRLAPRGAGRTVRLPEHTKALTNVVLGAFNSGRPCATKLNPPSDAALAIAAEIAGPAAASPVIDLAAYQQLLDGAEVS
jgi:transposase